MPLALAVVALWTATGMHKGAGISIVAFGITGYSTIMLWRNMPNRAIGAIEPNASLLTHRPVQMFDVFAARIVLEAVGATVSFAVLAFAAWMLEFMPAPENVLMVLSGWLLLAWYSFRTVPISVVGCDTKTPGSVIGQPMAVGKVFCLGCGAKSW